VNRHDLAGIRGAERSLLFADAPVLEHGHEQGFAGEQALAGAQQGPEETAALL
jgi:hypothetical protein